MVQDTCTRKYFDGAYLSTLSKGQIALGMAGIFATGIVFRELKGFVMLGLPLVGVPLGVFHTWKVYGSPKIDTDKLSKAVVAAKDALEK